MSRSIRIVSGQVMSSWRRKIELDSLFNSLHQKNSGWMKYLLFKYLISVHTGGCFNI